MFSCNQRKDTRQAKPLWAQLRDSSWYTGYELQVTGLGDRDEGVVSRISTGYSLCQLVASMVTESSIFQKVFYFTCAAVDDDTSFSNDFRTMCGVTFDEAALQASASNRTVIVIDEAQRIYNSSACL